MWSRRRTTMSSCSSAANRLGQNGGNSAMFIGRQPTGSEYIVFIGSQLAWTEQPKQGLAYHRMEETAFCSTVYGRNGVQFIGKGLAYRKAEETNLCLSSYSRSGVLLIGRGVAYRKTKETNSCCNTYGRNGRNIAMFIGRQPTGSEYVVFIRSQPAWTEQPKQGLTYRRTEETGLLFDRVRSKRGPVHREGCGVPQNGTPRDNVHLHCQPPPASTGSCSSSLHRALLHRLLFNHPSPWAHVQPPLPGLLFMSPWRGVVE